ncbi:FAD binding domain-containing protein [Ruminococcaceae bacterium OttesenSCG-928-I18]|nr:FAD binding domain-containing protein [Ruminococcaceae bacterium OttesenSCG-928-I18]
MWNEFESPQSVQDALVILEKHGGNARVMGGGTDLLMQLKSKRQTVECLVSTGKIASMKEIRLEGEKLVIGGAACAMQVQKDPLVRQYVPMLAQACAKLGAPQIRNAATLAGNVVTAKPAADSAVALTASDAVLEILGPTPRSIPLIDAYAGLMQSAVDSTKEMVVAIEIPLPTGRYGSHFARIASRRAAALPILNAAAALCLDDDGNITKSRVVVGGVGPSPQRLYTLEDMLQGQRGTIDLIEQVCGASPDHVHPRDSIRSSAAARKGLLPGLLKKCLLSSFEMATKKEG